MSLMQRADRETFTKCDGRVRKREREKPEITGLFTLRVRGVFGARASVQNFAHVSFVKTFNSLLCISLYVKWVLNSWGLQNVKQ